MSDEDRRGPMIRKKFWRRNRCPHVHIRGIYGDEINHTPGYRRLRCIDCGLLLDGPVNLATVESEWKFR